MRPNFLKLLKTHVEKMSVFGLSMMLMKTHELHHSSQDVVDKNGLIEDEGELVIYSF